jgi:hypothetical protein
VSRFVSEALAKHLRTAFTSGHDRIDRYFRETVSQDVKRGYAACYLLIERSSNKIAGFYTLSAHSIPLNDLPPELARKLPRHPSVTSSRRRSASMPSVPMPLMKTPLPSTGSTSFSSSSAIRQPCSCR